MAGVDKFEVVTDIVFISSMKFKPSEYTVIQQTFEGQDAQLLESGVGRQKGSSYLCYNKAVTKKYDFVIEDIYIHANKAEAPKEGYKIIDLTLDGNKAMRHVKLAVKRVPMHNAKSLVCDIAIFQNKNKDCIPEGYVVLPKVNNLRIAYWVRLDEASTPLPSSSTKTRTGTLLKHLSSIRKSKRREKVVTPITNIAMVTSLDNVPEGYNIIETCENGQDAQLWFNKKGGIAEERYLCYTKNERSDDSIVECIYMLGATDNVSGCLGENYSIIEKTVEGEEALKWKQIAVRRVAKSEAKKAVVDIKIFHNEDTLSIPKNYTAVNWSVNNLLICFLEHDKRGKWRH